MEYEKILDAASNEIVYQTSGENDEPNLFHSSRDPFPLKGYLDPDNVEDIIRVLQGRDDFRSLRDLLRKKAAEIYCRCAIVICEQNGIGHSDMAKYWKALSENNMDTALRAAKDLVMYEMDSSIRNVFYDYHAETMKVFGELEINVEVIKGNGDITLSAGEHVSVLGKAQIKHQGDLIMLLRKSLPEISDMLLQKRDDESAESDYNVLRM